MNDQTFETSESLIIRQMQRIAELETENAKLREVLRRIAISDLDNFREWAQSLALDTISTEAA